MGSRTEASALVPVGLVAFPRCRRVSSRTSHLRAGLDDIEFAILVAAFDVLRGAVVRLLHVHRDLADAAHEVVGKGLVGGELLVVVEDGLLRVCHHRDRVVQAGARKPWKVLAVGVRPVCVCVCVPSCMRMQYDT